MISIHALTRSATLRDLTLQLLSSYFNPRTHEECDDTVPDVGYVLTKFQSTHSRGVRHIQDGVIDDKMIFQSTHSRGVRPRIIAIINEFMYNSTD